MAVVMYAHVGSILLVWEPYFLYNCYSVLSLEICNDDPASTAHFAHFAIAAWGLLCYHINFKILFSISVMNIVRDSVQDYI